MTCTCKITDPLGSHEATCRLYEDVARAARSLLEDRLAMASLKWDALQEALNHLDAHTVARCPECRRDYSYPCARTPGKFICRRCGYVFPESRVQRQMKRERVSPRPRLPEDDDAPASPPDCADCQAVLAELVDHPNPESVFEWFNAGKHVCGKDRNQQQGFAVTDPDEDAPDGAVIDGHERVGNRWKPVQP